MALIKVRLNLEIYVLEYTMLHNVIVYHRAYLQQVKYI